MKTVVVNMLTGPDAGEKYVPGQKIFLRWKMKCRSN